MANSLPGCRVSKETMLSDPLQAATSSTVFARGLLIQIFARDQLVPIIVVSFFVSFNLLQNKILYHCTS